MFILLLFGFRCGFLDSLYRRRLAIIRSADRSYRTTMSESHHRDDIEATKDVRLSSAPQGLIHNSTDEVFIGSG